MNLPSATFQNEENADEKTLRVLHFIPFVGWAGANTAAMTLIAEQAKRRPTYLLAMNEAHTSAVARSHGVIVEKAHDGGDWPRFKPFSWLKIYRGLHRMIRRYDINVLHTHSAAGMKYCAPIKHLTGIKIVSHQRDNFVRDRFHQGIGGADKIVCVSDWILKGLPSELKSRSVTWHDAVELPDWPQQPVPGGPRICVGMAGRCDAIKGMHTFLEATLPLMERLDFSILLQGLSENDYGRKLRERVERAPDFVRDRVRLEPFQPETDIFYRAIDLAVVPSTYPDPFPRTVSEAMTRYKPTIVAAHGGMIELVVNGENGLTFKPGDAADLARAIEQLIANPRQIIQMGLAGRHSVERKLDPVRYADAMDDIYKALL